MTLDEFFARLNQSCRERGWKPRYAYLWNAGLPVIRVKVGDQYCCPLTAYFNPGAALAGARNLAERNGMNWSDAEAVYCAADANIGYDPQIRARLVEALGLTPELTGDRE
jgi:hypothetical protein